MVLIFFFWNIFISFLPDIILLNLQIIDEKSLIKKYQNEIRSLKEELEQLKKGIVTVPQLKDADENDILLLKQKVHFNSSTGWSQGYFGDCNSSDILLLKILVTFEEITLE